MKAESQRIYSIYLPTYIHISQSHILFFFNALVGWGGAVLFVSDFFVHDVTFFL